MERKAYGIGVSVDKQEVRISQDGVGNEDDMVVTLNVEQIPMLVKWLEEANIEIRAA